MENSNGFLYDQSTGTRKFRPTPRAVSSQSRLIQVSGDLKSGEITRRDHSNYFETNLVPNKECCGGELCSSLDAAGRAR
jgi:hypothetical protein